MNIKNYIGETSDCEKKEKLEINKPKSWLKSVSAFANGNGGTLIFGISDTDSLVGLKDVKNDCEKMSEMIKTRIDPKPIIDLKIHNDNGKSFIILEVLAGSETPYYYVSDGNRIAYVRVGNESVPADALTLRRLVLKSMNITYDGMSSPFELKYNSFNLFKKFYQKQTGLVFVDKDYASFNLVDERGFLTNAGALLADEPLIRHSRLFCTRWYGLDKASGVVDALDDAEYSGSLVYLLKSGEEFVKKNTKKGWKKVGQERVELPDYPIQAVHEVLVNALIHREIYGVRK